MVVIFVAVGGFVATVGASLLFAWLWYSGSADQEFVAEMFDVEDRISDGGDCSECGATWETDVVSAGPGNTMMQHEHGCRYARWAKADRRAPVAVCPVCDGYLEYDDDDSNICMSCGVTRWQP